MSSKRLETHQKLLQTVADLVERGDGLAVRMADIATAAGVSRQTLYLHFGSRTELLIEATRYHDDQLNTEERYQSVADTTNAAEHLDAFIAFWGEHVSLIYGMAKALWDDLDKDGAATAAWDDRMKATRSACSVAISKIADEGALNPNWTSESATDFLFALLSIRNWELLTKKCGWTVEEYVARQQLAAQRALFT